MCSEGVEQAGREILSNEEKPLKIIPVDKVGTTRGKTDKLPQFK